MTSGIYKLEFSNGLFYVGKSTDIKRRWKEHFTKFEKGTAAKPLQAAFNKYGFPSTEVLLYCHEDNIDVMEAAYIHVGLKQWGTNYCLNTSIPKDPGFTSYDNTIVEKSLKDQMEYVKKLRSNIEQLEGELEQQELDHQKEMTLIKTGTRLRVIEQKLQDTILKEQKLIEDLKRIQSRNWFQRLFNL